MRRGIFFFILIKIILFFYIWAPIGDGGRGGAGDYSMVHFPRKNKWKLKKAFKAFCLVFQLKTCFMFSCYMFFFFFWNPKISFYQKTLSWYHFDAFIFRLSTHPISNCSKISTSGNMSERLNIVLNLLNSIWFLNRKFVFFLKVFQNEFSKILILYEVDYFSLTLLYCYFRFL